MPLLVIVLPFAALVAYVIVARRMSSGASSAAVLTQSPGAPPPIDATYIPPLGELDLPANEAPPAPIAEAPPRDDAAEPADTGFLAALSGALEAMSANARRVFALPARAAPYADSIRAAEQRYGLPDTLLARLLMQESAFLPKYITGAERSSAGAIGIAQFMPATARELGVDPLNTNDAIDGAARYLKRLREATGDWTHALAAYNWGIGNLQRKGLAAAPPETQKYVADISRDVDLI